jgi:hypothetical protein
MIIRVRTALINGALAAIVAALVLGGKGHAAAQISAIPPE